MQTSGLHPVSKQAGLLVCEKKVEKENVMVTLMLWKKGKKAFTKKELNPVKSVKIAEDNSSVTITMSDGSVKEVTF